MPRQRDARRPFPREDRQDLSGSVEGNVQGVICRDRDVIGCSGADLLYFSEFRIDPWRPGSEVIVNFSGDLHVKPVVRRSGSGTAVTMTVTSSITAPRISSSRASGFNARKSVVMPGSSPSCHSCSPPILHQIPRTPGYAGSDPQSCVFPFQRPGAHEGNYRPSNWALCPLSGHANPTNPAIGR